MNKSISICNYSIMSALALAYLFIAVGCSQPGSASKTTSGHWIGTWASSAQEVEAQLMPADFKRLDDTTIRQIVRVSVGGERVSVRLSNHFAYCCFYRW